MIRASGVLEYSSTPKAANYSSILLLLDTCYFIFPAANFHFRLQFLQSSDELMEFMETGGFAISFATCQPANKSEYVHVDGALVQGSGPFEPQVR